MAKKTPRNQIREGKKLLEELMLSHLSAIADGMISTVMGRARRLTPSQRLNAIKDLKPQGVLAYRAELLDAMAALSYDALEAARTEVPKAKKVQLTETQFEKLPPALQKKLKSRLDLLVGKQLGDLQKVIEFAYAQNEDTTDSDDQIEADLKDSAVGWLDGTALQSGAEITAATVVADARDAFFFDSDVLEEIAAFEFVNGDPVSDICKDLAGTVFAKDDPDMFRYTPPLHWNCKSYIRPILAGKMGNRTIEKLKPSSKKLEASIQFAEHTCRGCQSAESEGQAMLDEALQCLQNG